MLKATISAVLSLSPSILSVEDDRVILNPEIVQTEDGRQAIAQMMATLDTSGYVFVSTTPTIIDRKNKKYAGNWYYSIAPKAIEGTLSFEPVAKPSKERSPRKPSLTFAQVMVIITNKEFKKQFQVYDTELTNDKGDTYQGTRIRIGEYEFFDACLPMRHCANRGHVIPTTGLGVWLLRAAEQWAEQSDVPANKRVLDGFAICEARHDYESRIEKRTAIFVPEIAQDGTRMTGDAPEVVNNDDTDESND